MCRTLHTQVRLVIAFVLTCCCLRLLCALIDVETEARESQLAVFVVLWQTHRCSYLQTASTNVTSCWLWSALHRHLIVVVGRRMLECSRSLFRVPTNSVDHCSGLLLACYHSKSVLLCSLSHSVNPSHTGPCTTKTSKRTWGSFAWKVAPGLENAARGTCTIVWRSCERLPVPFCCCCFCFFKSASTHTAPKWSDWI